MTNLSVHVVHLVVQTGRTHCRYLIVLEYAVARSTSAQKELRVSQGTLSRWLRSCLYIEQP